MDIPEGWTDDMSIALPAGLTVDHVVDTILASEGAGSAADQLYAELTSLGLSPEDATLARERVLGGLVRAATGNPMNEPTRDKDPMAWTSYHRARRTPELLVIAQRLLPPREADPLTPEVTTKRWWRFWRRR